MRRREARLSDEGEWSRTAVVLDVGAAARRERDDNDVVVVGSVYTGLLLRVERLVVILDMNLIDYG